MKLFECDCNVSTFENNDIEINGEADIVIIQGDTYRREIKIDIDKELVKDLYFSCSDLNLTKKCVYEDEVYVLEFQPYETIKLDKYVGTYDLTLELVDGTIMTLCLNKSFMVLCKKNKIGETPEQEEEIIDVELDFSQSDTQVIRNEKKYITININKPTTLQEDNIRKDINVAGIIGNVIPLEVKKGLIFFDYDENGYPHNLSLVGEWDSIPSYYFANISNTDNVFKNLNDINLIIPEGTTTIKNNILDSNKLIKNITLPKSVNWFYSSAFRNCSGLTNVYYLGTIEDWCNIKMGNIASNYRTMTPMRYANHFYMLDENNEYKEVTNITIPDTITTLATAVFYGFGYVTSIEIPNSVTSIGEYAFEYCTDLTSIEIPNSVTSIGEATFSECVSLTSITIPNKVRDISAKALNIGSSSNKATITFKPTTPPTIQSNTFTSSYLNKIYVPSASLEAYKTATNWVNFADYIEADPNE